MTTVEERIAKIMTDLVTAKTNLFNATEVVIKAQQAVEAAEYAALLSDAINGSNAEKRKAQLAQIIAPQVEALRNAERDQRAAKMQHDLATLAMDGMKLLSSFAA